MYGILGLLFGGANLVSEKRKNTKYNKERGGYTSLYGEKRGFEEHVYLSSCINMDQRIAKIANMDLDIPYNSAELKYIEEAVKSGRNLMQSIKDRYEKQKGNSVEIEIMKQTGEW